MSFFVVTYTHPDEAGWNEHLGRHVDWLVNEVRTGRLKASGPVLDTPVRSAMLIIEAVDRDHLDAIIATDPFHSEGLIEDRTVTRWDPVFGAFAPPSDESPGATQP